MTKKKQCQRQTNKGPCRRWCPSLDSHAVQGWTKAWRSNPWQSTGTFACLWYLYSPCSLASERAKFGSIGIWATRTRWSAGGILHRDIYISVQWDSIFACRCVLIRASHQHHMLSYTSKPLIDKSTPWLKSWYGKTLCWDQRVASDISESALELSC